MPDLHFGFHKAKDGRRLAIEAPSEQMLEAQQKFSRFESKTRLQHGQLFTEISPINEGSIRLIPNAYELNHLERKKRILAAAGMSILIGLLVEGCEQAELGDEKFVLHQFGNVGKDFQLRAAAVHPLVSEDRVRDAVLSGSVPLAQHLRLYEGALERGEYRAQMASGIEVSPDQLSMSLDGGKSRLETVDGFQAETVELVGRDLKPGLLPIIALAQALAVAQAAEIIRT